MKVPVKQDSIQIEITYQNNTNDTIYLPKDELRLTNFQTINFWNIEIECGAMAKMSQPFNLGDCNLKCMEEAHFKGILPHKSISLIFTSKELSCLDNDMFKVKGKEYIYFVTLYLDSSFKIYHPKVWTGGARSDKGSFIVR